MTTDSVIILGTSSGLPQASRANSGYILSINGRLALIDCGGGATSSFLKAGLDPLSVDVIFISHTHPDHVCELPLFIQLIYLKGRTQRLDVYVPSEFREILNKYLSALYIIREKLPFELVINGYESGFEYKNNFTLTAHPTKHLLKYKDNIASLGLPNKMQCHCFVIVIGPHKILYSADIESIADIKMHFTNCRFVIIESTHIEMDEFLAIAADFKSEQFIITHLGAPEEVAIIRAKISKAALKNVVIAEDRMRLAI